MQKYVKGDVSIRDSLKKNVSQRGLGSHRPHGTRAGPLGSLVAGNSLWRLGFDSR